MVLEAGLEPACLAAEDFKSSEYTISPLEHDVAIVKEHFTSCET
jgi:hypothetical protein